MSHNNMATFFSGTDTSTLQEFAPVYNNYLSLIVNNAGTYTAALATNATVEGIVKEKITYKGLDFQDKVYDCEEQESNKQVILKFDAKIIKEGTDFNNEEFINNVEELKKNAEKQSYKKQSYITAEYFGNSGHQAGYQNPQLDLNFKEDKRFSTDITDSQATDFICKLASQSYFYDIACYKEFATNLMDALGKVPKNMTLQKYSVMVYEFIDSLLSYMDITSEDDQALLVLKCIEKLESLKYKTEYCMELYECLQSFIEQITEDFTDLDEIKELDFNEKAGIKTI